MNEEHLIVKEVKKASKDMELADTMIRKYMPFIKKEVAHFINGPALDNIDEVSIGMIAFHEAIKTYNSSRGSFLNFAALLIRSRLIDFTKIYYRHRDEISLDMKINMKDDHNLTLKDVMPSKEDLNKEVIEKNATRQELTEFKNDLQEYGLKLTDIAENCPKQSRTFNSMKIIFAYVLKNPDILKKMMSKKQLPIKDLVNGSGVSKKIIERHRKYLIAILLIQTNGYDILRSHIKSLMKGDQL